MCERIKEIIINLELIIESLKNKIVFITGASSGIGEACAIEFARQGANLILTARRKNLLDQLAENLCKEFNVNVITFQLDVRDKIEVKYVIENLPSEWKNIDILVNNAGLGRGLNKIYEDNIEGWDEMIDTNIKGLLYVTRQILPGMVERKKGHIINIGSIAGHEAYARGGVYCATKHAVTAITKTLRMELIDQGVRVSTVDPGLVETNFSRIRFYGDEERAKSIYKGVEPLTGKDVAEAVIFCATRPPNANVAELILFAATQAASTVIYRKE